MRAIGENIWVHEDTMPLLGTQLELRMTIVRLSNGLLWVHSPTAINDSLKAKLQVLGEVGFILGPNNGHNLWLLAWRNAYPDAALFVSAGIPKKLKLDNYLLLDESSVNKWQDTLQGAYMPGVPFFNESIFLHQESRSLIVTDLIQNHSPEIPDGLAGIIKRFLFQPVGFKGKCVAPPLKLGFPIKDKAAFSAFIQRIQSWDFDKIVVTHGDIIDSDARQLFADLSQRFII